jgi:hypothetical protein
MVLSSYTEVYLVIYDKGGDLVALGDSQAVVLPVLQYLLPSLVFRVSGQTVKYRGTSLTRNRTSLGPYGRPMSRVLGGAYTVIAREREREQVTSPWTACGRKGAGGCVSGGVGSERGRERSCMKCVSIQKISGSEVYYTILSRLLVKIMLCSRLHCQRSFKLKHISY